MSNIKRIIIDCPECGSDAVNQIIDLTGKTNEFHSMEIEQTTFECTNCNKTLYTGELEILTEDEI